MYYRNRFPHETLEGLVLSMSPVRAQNPAFWPDDDDDALVYTMRDLNQQTAPSWPIEKTGNPAFITRHGRFVAIITPLAPGKVESRVLAEMARELANRADDEPAANRDSAPALVACIAYWRVTLVPVWAYLHLGLPLRFLSICLILTFPPYQVKSEPGQRRRLVGRGGPNGSVVVG